MIKIKKLKGISFDLLYDAFSHAFEDYDAPALTKEALAIMLERRGFSPEHSFGAFYDDKLVSFTFNGIGEYKGKTTAYDAGTGTIKEYRGQKLVGRIFDKSIPLLKKKGVEQCLLEVQQHNTTAFNIYRNHGFEISREFNYYFIDSDKFQYKAHQVSCEDYSIRKVDLLEFEVITSFWDFEPSWQNSLEAINRRSEDFKALGIHKGNQLVGYGVIDSSSGDITQLAVSKDHRRKYLGTVLINELIKLNKHLLIKIVNTEKGYVPMEKLFDSLPIPLTGHQYEMVKLL